MTCLSEAALLDGCMGHILPSAHRMNLLSTSTSLLFMLAGVANLLHFVSAFRRSIRVWFSVGISSVFSYTWFFAECFDKYLSSYKIVICSTVSFINCYASHTDPFAFSHILFIEVHCNFSEFHICRWFSAFLLAWSQYTTFNPMKKPNSKDFQFFFVFLFYFHFYFIYFFHSLISRFTYRI